jgi:hypothetical protein
MHILLLCFCVLTLYSVLGSLVLFLLLLIISGSVVILDFTVS